MTYPRIRITLLCVWGSLFSPVSVLFAADQEPSHLPTTNVMAVRIDELLAERWQEAGMEPAAPATDEQFLRRVSLDLTGTIPRVSRVREFLDDEQPDRRQQLVAELLESPAHATHLANTWRHFMLPGGIDPEQLPSVVGLQQWLRGQLVENVRYDRVVADLLVARGGQSADPALFYTSVGLEPEKLATATARIFLGIQLDCAQCHDHPFDAWTQRDFWGYAAFFSRVGQANGSRRGNTIRLVDRQQGEVTIPETEAVVLPVYPGGLDAAPDNWQ